MGPWTVEMTIILRHMVNDLATTPTYADTRLQQLILVSAQLVQGEVVITNPYVVDIVSGTISPDPTVNNTRNDSFINLVLTKAACIIDNSEARLAAGKGVRMRDADKEIDLRTASEGKLAIWNKGWCQNYKQTRLEFLAGGSATAGAAIVGPFREEINIPSGPWSPDGYGLGLGYAPEYGYNGAEYGGYR